MKTQVYSKEQIINKIEYFCAYRERCKSEIIQKLVQLQVQTSEVDFYLNHLKESNFWNEERFIKAFVAGKLSTKNWGKQKIIQQLYAKKIDSKNIHDSIINIDEDFYLQKLEDVLIKKNKTIKEIDIFIRKKKLQNFAIQKGYELENINLVLKKIDI